jgi:hypothetical protein
MTYPSSIWNRHSPGSAATGTLGTAIHPDIEVLVAVAGGSVPVAAGIVVRHIGYV